MNRLLPALLASALAVTACVSPTKRVQLDDTGYEMPDIMSGAVGSCASVLRARYAGLLPDPQEIPNMETLLGIENATPALEEDDPEQPFVSVPPDELILFPSSGLKNMRVDLIKFKRSDLSLEGFPALAELIDSMYVPYGERVFPFEELYEEAWKLLDGKNELSGIEQVRIVQPVEVLDEFARELKEHLHEHGFGHNDWLRGPMCEPDFPFFKIFTDSYLDERFRKNMPHVGAFQSARARVGLAHLELDREK